MGYYVIGIGGTGAKCIEALTHLCAAGLMPAGELYTVFVDPDKSNGSLDRAQITLKQYTDCKEIPMGETDLFKTKITIAEPDVWSPFEEAKPRLDDFFLYNNMRNENKNAAHLFDVLYSVEEKETTLEKGFRGHPSIGAAVMAKTLKLGEGDPWTTFREKLRLDVGAGPGARIILVGSIFGGTGASGLPTIARLIREEVGKVNEHSTANKGDQLRVKIGGVLMLPYFSFSPVTEEKLRADAESFLLNTQASLKYYHQQAGLRIYDAVYLLGEHTLCPVKKPSIGGPEQKNEPHFMELYAALACVDFFVREKVEDYQLIAREHPNRIHWEDLPYQMSGQPDHQQLRSKIGQIARFAFAYLCAYYPMLNDINRNGKSYRAPWYINLFKREGIDLKESLQQELPAMKRYCEMFLQWLASIQVSTPDIQQLKLKLINYDAFSAIGERDVIELSDPSNFAISRFDNLLIPEAEEYRHGLHRLWEKMSDARVRSNGATGVGKFLSTLYKECAKR